MPKQLSNKNGTVIIFVTLMLVLLMIMVGMGVDAGQMTYARNQGQAAVDAAALSAVSGLPTRNPTQIAGRAAGFNSTNDYVGSKTNQISTRNVGYVRYDYATNAITDYNANINVANGVRVALEKLSGGSEITTPLFLTPLLNLLGIDAPSAEDINVSAVATISGKPSIPIAVWNSLCLGNGATKFDVDLEQQNPGSENSCWTTYLDKSSGASDIKALFNASESCSGLPQDVNASSIDVGTPIYENKGQAATVYDTAEEFFFRNSKTKNRCWLVPVIKGSGNCNSKNPTPIKDWAKICPTKMVKYGAHSYIRVNLTCNQSIREAENSLCFSHRLVREPTKGY